MKKYDSGRQRKNIIHKVKFTTSNNKILILKGVIN